MLATVIQQEHTSISVTCHLSNVSVLFTACAFSSLMSTHFLQVNVVETRRSILHFLTNVCAIVGGVFTVSGILDSTVYHGQRLIRKKKELGKYG